MYDPNGGLDLDPGWFQCLGCDAEYRSKNASRLCCDRQAQKAAVGRLSAQERL